MELQFTYSLSGAGWTDARISIGNISREIVVSYLNDSLYELANGINLILSKEKSSVEIHFLDEPGEHKLVLTELKNNELLVELFWSDDWVEWNKVDMSTYKPILSTITTTNHFASLILSILENLITKHGEANYQDLWINHPFPIQEYQKLKQLI